MIRRHISLTGPPRRPSRGAVTGRRPSTGRLLACAASAALALLASPALACPGAPHPTAAPPCGAAPAADTSAPPGPAGATATIAGLVVAQPWARATPGGAKVGGGYLTITNTGREPDRLVGGSVEVAGRFEIHEMSVTDGVMRMRPVDGITVAPGASVELKPGGLHAMFLDLLEPLREGRTVRGTLVFERAGTVPITFVVRGIGSASGAEHRH
jgi:periplasmic copper chaperone A